MKDSTRRDNVTIWILTCNERVSCLRRTRRRHHSHAHGRHTPHPPSDRPIVHAPAIINPWTASHPSPTFDEAKLVGRRFLDPDLGPCLITGPGPPANPTPVT
jgi:hypothetical protein